MLLYETRLRTNFSPGNIVFQGDLNTIFHYDIHEFIEALDGQEVSVMQSLGLNA